MWLVQHILLLLTLQRLLDLLPPQYSTYICVRWPDIFLAGSATLPAPTPPTLLLPWALAVWHVTGFGSEWVRLSGLGLAPGRSYRMCMLDVFSAGGAAKATLNRLTLSPLPRTSQAHYLPISGPARVSTSPNQTCTLLLCVPPREALDKLQLRIFL